MDGSGGVYVTGYSTSVDPPLTYGAFQTSLQGLMDGWILKIGPGSEEGFASISAASFRNASGISPESIASGFGAGLASTVTVASTTTLPVTLDDVTVIVKDTSGVERAAPLFFVSPGQINYLTPPGTKSGLAAVTVNRSGMAVASGVVQINRVAPALFSANATGQGVAAATVLRVRSDGTRSEEAVFECGATSGSCVSRAIDLGPVGDQVYVLLYGTGIRNLTTPAIAKVGSLTVPVLAAGAQGQFAGLDQVNIGPLSRSLAGSGELTIELTIDGIQSNLVAISIR